MSIWDTFKGKPEKPDPDAGLITRITDRFKDGKDRIDEQWKQRTVDMRFVDGDTLDPNERQLRKSTNRPWFDLDEINQYENQVINEILANKRGVKFSPVGYGANDETARFYADKMREIEYRSKAGTIAYPMALKNCVWGSFGFVRLKLKYKQTDARVMAQLAEQGDPTAFQQDLWIEQVADPNTVLPDQDFQMPDMSDINDLFVLEQYSHDEFTRKFPWAKIQSFSNTHIKNSQGWVNAKTVQVAEYYHIEQEKAFTLALIEDAQGNPRVIKADVLKAQGMPEGFEFKRERDVDQPKVYHCLTNGVEILEKTDWPGIYIPFAGCFGKMFWRDKGSGTERVVHSMTRLARNPATLYSYYNTCEGEMLRLVPKFPYFYYEGTLSEGMLDLLQKSYDEPVAGIAVKHTIDGVMSGGPLGFPQRAPWDPPFIALQAGKESARQGIRAAMGLMPLSTNAGKLNDKSGVALKEMAATSQQGAYHFPHAMNMMIEFVGVQCEDLFPKVLTGARDEAVFDAEMKPRTVKINQERPMGMQDDEVDVLPSIAGVHQVTVSVGPSDDSEREQANDFVDTLVGSKEMLMIAGPEGAKKIVASAIRLKNIGPEGDRMAEVYDPKEEEGQMPPQAQALIAEAKQIAEALAQENGQLKQQLEGKQLEIQSKESIAAQDDATKRYIAELQAEQKQAEADLRAQVDLKLQQMDDAIARAELVIKAHQVDTEQQHQREMASISHRQALESGAVGHEQAETSAERAAEREAARETSE